MPDTLDTFLSLVSNLGDSGLLVALTFCCVLYLSATDNKRTAAILFSALLVCMVIMGLLKVFFIPCHDHFPDWHIVSPSGHAAMSAAIYGTLAALATKRLPTVLQWTAILGAMLLIGTIAAARVLQGQHTLNEVLLGLGIGCTIAVTAATFLQPVTHVAFRLRYLALSALVALVLLYGTHAPAEIFIRHFALFLNNTLHFCA